MPPRDYLQGSQTASRRMRKDSGPGGILVGYEDLTGTPKPVPGDEKFPFFLSPPDLGVSAAYLTQAAVPAPILFDDAPSFTQVALDQWAQGAAIDVRGVRLLTFYMNLVATPVATMNGLGIVPQAAIDLGLMQADGASPGGYLSYAGDVDGNPLRWYSIGVVDATARGAFPTASNPATAMVAPSYAFRYAHGSELVVPFTDVPAGAGITTGVNLTLVFDVTAYQWFRLLYNGVLIDTPPGVTYDFPVAEGARSPTLNMLYQVAR